MFDRVIEGLMAQLAALHALRAPGEWIVVAFASGVVLAGLVVPAGQRLLRRLDEFSAWCAWRGEQNRREEQATAKRVESEAVLSLIAARKQVTQDAEYESIELAELIEDGDEESLKTIAMAPLDKELRRLGVGVKEAAGPHVAKRRVPQAQDFVAARSMLERRQELAS